MDTQNITLTVNGEQAAKTLASLRQHAAALSDSLRKALEAGDTKGAKTLQKELAAVNKEIQGIQSSARNAEDVLRSLDSATPKELRKTLAALNKDLKDIQRGSDAWKAQTEKIAAVKAELKKVQDQTAASKSMFEQLGTMPGPIGKLTQAIQGTAKSLKLLLANPVGAVIAAVSVAIGAVISAFKRSEESMNTLKQAFSAFNPIIDAVKRGFDAFAKVLADVVLASVNGLVSGISWLMSLLDEVGGWFGQDWHFEDNFKKGQEAAQQLTQAEQDYLKHKRQNTEEEAKLEQEIARLRDKAVQKDKYTAEQRVAFMQQAIAKEREVADKRIALAREELAIAEANAARGENDAATNDRLSELRANVTRAETEYYNNARRLQTQLQTFRKEVNDETLKNETDHTDRLQAELDRRNTLLRIQYARGGIDNGEYQQQQLQNEIEYYERKLQQTELGEQEALELTARLEEARRKLKGESNKQLLKDEENAYKDMLLDLQRQNTEGLLTDDAYHRAKEDAELAHLRRLADMQEEGTQERLDAERRYTEASLALQKQRNEEAAKAEENSGNKLEEAGLKVQDITSKLSEATSAILNGNFPEIEKAAKSLFELVDAAAQGDAAGIVGAVNNVIQTTMSTLTAQVQAELATQQAAITASYDKQIEAAAGNNDKQKQLEQQKQQELAKIKKDASRKMFAMQVIQAVASTAQAALNAYQSAAAIPVAGFVLGPIAAAAATAMGLVQIASIRQQQQQAESIGYASGGYVRPLPFSLSGASGISREYGSSLSGASGISRKDYASGGYTKKGGKYEPAGIVHAGEWVASQELLANPAAANTIALLDHAQRTNAIASLGARSSSLSGAPGVSREYGSSLSGAPGVSREYASSLSDSSLLSRLSQQLSQPITAVATIGGNHGIKAATDDYERLIANKQRS